MGKVQLSLHKEQILWYKTSFIILDKKELGNNLIYNYNKLMEQLRQINKQDFLQELRYRVENEEITEEEIIILMKNYLLKDGEKWKKGYELAAKDKEREKELAEWDRIQKGDEKLLADAYEAWANDPNEQKDVKEKY